ncbi:MAG: hypothetical protein M0Z49_07615 [Chloroflexi bacterium]|nr:hypothetical protein [Chloroflexota bacterium]
MAGFLGPPALEKGASPPVIVGAALLLLSVGAAVFVLLPSTGWRFVVGTRALLRDYIEADPPATMAELHRSLAWHLEDDWDQNQGQPTRRYVVFAVSAVAVIGETIALLTAIAQKGT